MKPDARMTLAAALGPSFYRNTVMGYRLAPMSPNGERWEKMLAKADRMITYLRERGFDVVELKK